MSFHNESLFCGFLLEFQFNLASFLSQIAVILKNSELCNVKIGLKIFTAVIS